MARVFQAFIDEISEPENIADRRHAMPLGLNSVDVEHLTFLRCADRARDPVLASRRPHRRAHPFSPRAAKPIREQRQTRIQPSRETQP